MKKEHTSWKEFTQFLLINWKFSDYYCMILNTFNFLNIRTWYASLFFKVILSHCNLMWVTDVTLNRNIQMFVQHFKYFTILFIINSDKKFISSNTVSKNFFLNIQIDYFFHLNIRIIFIFWFNIKKLDVKMIFLVIR